MKIAVLYASREGQTASIAARIASQLEAVDEIQCDCLDIAHLPDNVELANYHAVLMGCSIHYGHFASVFRHYAEAHAAQLNAMPSAFFSVSLVARKPGKDTPETNVYTRKFLASTSWKPRHSAAFAGAVKYDMYRWWDRIIVQLIMAMGKGETGRHAHVEYTDWDAVTRFVQHIRTEVLQERS